MPSSGYVPSIPPTTIPVTEVPLNPAAPLSPAQPSANPLVNAAMGLGPVAVANYAVSNVAGPELSMIAGAVNIVIEYLKNRKWFREEVWTVPLLIALSFAIAFAIWFFFLHDLLKAISNGCGILSTCHLNYHGAQVSGVGIFKPTEAQNKHGATADVPELVIASS